MPTPTPRTIIFCTGPSWRLRDNEVLLRVWDSLDMESRARIALARPCIDLRQAAESHQAIVDALEQGDGKLAGKLLREHAEACSRRIEQNARRKSRPAQERGPHRKWSAPPSFIAAWKARFASKSQHPRAMVLRNSAERAF